VILTKTLATPFPGFSTRAHMFEAFFEKPSKTESQKDPCGRVVDILKFFFTDLAMFSLN
jgi:hypothetical protein